MRRVIAGVALALTVAACGSAHAASPPNAGDGGNFLSTYVHDLTTAEPHDNACHPQTAADLLISPCDQGGKP